MARDFENVHGLDDLSDRELRDLVRDRLAEHNGLDAGDITVRVADGRVTLEGAVGTEAERRIAEHLLTDALGLTQVRNNLVVSTLRRAESPLDIEEHLVDEERTEGLVYGDRAVPLSPEAEHLDENLDAQLGGTSDIGKAIGEGASWIPPEAATPEGLDGTER